eukprot:1275378-Pyramimonas_sp.AAC.1
MGLSLDALLACTATRQTCAGVMQMWRSSLETGISPNTSLTCTITTYRIPEKGCRAAPVQHWARARERGTRGCIPA